MWCSINQANFTLLHVGFSYMIAADCSNPSIKVDARAVAFPVKKILLLRQFLAWSCAVPSTPFAQLPPTTQLARNVSCPRWLRLLRLVVEQCSSPAMSCALVGQDRWGLLCIRLARPQCQSPCGATAIWLAVHRLVARPQCLMPSLAETTGACCA
jgi:hypothetical protein